jgi:hypothetical protein
MATPAGTGAETSIPVEFTKAEAVALANALFMCLRPNNVRPPFEPIVNIEEMEAAYRKVATPVSELQERRCGRCGRAWDETAGPWDAIGDPETGDTELVCLECVTPEEQAMLREHGQRLIHYAEKLYSTPAWRGTQGHA